jgi:flagellar basal body rod protein FlgC
MDISATALQGLQQADVQLQTAASAIANAPSQGGGDVVDLSREMVALMSAKQLYDANLDTLKTADQMQKTLIDITA